MDRYQWDGQWSGNRNYPVKTGDNPVVAHTLGKVDLTLKDGRYELFEGGIPRSGVFDRGGATLKLTSTLVMEHKMPTSADGALRQIDPDTIEYFGGRSDISPVRLKREAQPAK